jgi:hypothetical protein
MPWKLREVEVELNAFLSAALNGGGLSDSRPGHSVPAEKLQVPTEQVDGGALQTVWEVWRKEHDLALMSIEANTFLIHPVV